MAPAPAIAAAPVPLAIAAPAQHAAIAAPAPEALEPEAAEPEVDEFASAARLFSFTGEVPTTPVAEAAAEPEPAPDAPASDAVARGGRRRLSARRAVTASFSVGVLGVVGMLTVGMTMAPQAVAAVAGTDTTRASSNIVVAGDVRPGSGDEIQAYVAPATVQNSSLDRSDYSTGSIAATAASLGITQTSNFFVNNPNSPIQWPFAVGVPISYGFGWRTDVDTGTEFHEGADFTPGNGAHVQAIADGTVRIATENGGAYGVTIVLDHQIDGQLISTRYAHMQVGSLQVKVGDRVKVGQYIGRTGDTGFSFGAHTHVEVLVNGITPIDPIAWLRQHAGG
ncbi:M23 family metallopeptidase [Microbacterium sp. X-17]|uniref:M23 family metallopeptidase n=1 Tax=Microbacterium sp. X-17 TaxID=3144404 RepID=UPI0031F49ABA